MQDKLILRLSIMITISGILILLILSYNLEPKLIKIKEINSNDIYKKIKIQGKVTKTKNYDNFKIIELTDNSGKINIMINNPNLNFSINQTLTAIGKITEYKNELEVSADKIKF